MLLAEHYHQFDVIGYTALVVQEPKLHDLMKLDSWYNLPAPYAAQIKSKA